MTKFIMREPSLFLQTSSTSWTKFQLLIGFQTLGVFLLVNQISINMEVFGAVIGKGNVPNTWRNPQEKGVAVRHEYILTDGNATLRKIMEIVQNSELAMSSGIKSGRKARNLGSCRNNIHYHFSSNQNGADNFGGGIWNGRPNEYFPTWEDDVEEDHVSKGDNYHKWLTCFFRPQCFGSFDGGGKNACFKVGAVYPGDKDSSWFKGNGCKASLDWKYDCCSEKLQYSCEWGDCRKTCARGTLPTGFTTNQGCENVHHKRPYCCKRR